jgi:hypothetical protein
LSRNLGHLKLRAIARPRKEVGAARQEDKLAVTISMSQSSVDVFVPFLGNLSSLLDHAASYVEARKIDPDVLLEMRLSPTMYNLTQQVGEANRHAVVACALLADRTADVFQDRARNIAGLQDNIASAIEFVTRLPREAIDKAAERDVVFTFKNGNTRPFTGRSLLLTFSLPQFFFHVTTAYDILRHAGVDLAKRDFLGPPR